VAGQEKRGRSPIPTAAAWRPRRAAHRAIEAVDGGRGLAPYAADPAAARVDPVERVGDPRLALDEYPDVARGHLLAPGPAPRRAAGDCCGGGGLCGGVGAVQLPGGELGADAGAADGDVPGVEGAAPRRPPESPPVAAAVATESCLRVCH
jgi:hypothetical protein